VGDALGAPMEGWDQGRLNATLDAFLDLPRARQELTRAVLGPIVGGTGPAYYTDDGQMTLGIAESLIAVQGIYETDMARRFAENFDPKRGYGMGARKILTAIRNGESWQDAGSRLFGGNGSYGNGAAMRVAPIGLFFHDANAAALRDAAERSASITHTHRLGKEGAVVQATAIATAVHRGADGTSPDPEDFLAELRERVGDGDEIYQKKLTDIAELLNTRPARHQVTQRLGNDVSAPLSVPAAIYAFLANNDSFEKAVLYAIRLGGDTDTITAMAGAIAGAFHGASAIPVRWLDALENGMKGRDYARRLADALFTTWQQKAR
jgi:poly(ADP-ribose) glycohydrolase ARH3